MNSNFNENYHDEYLYHHGILGQKWGVRRFQNANGSYTPAGQSRYGPSYRAKLNGTSTSRIKKAASATASTVGKAVVGTSKTVGKAAVVTTKAVGKTTASAAKKVGSSLSSVVRNQNEKRKAKKEEKKAREKEMQRRADDIVADVTSTRFPRDVSSLSDDDLKALVERAKLEQSYQQTISSLNPTSSSSLKKKVSKIADDIVTQSVKNVGTKVVTKWLGDLANVSTDGSDNKAKEGSDNKAKEGSNS